MTKDIAGLLCRIKDNIRLIDGGVSPEALSDELCADFLEMIELIKLFLISERDSYYGYFLMNMQFAAELDSDSIAGIKLNTFPPVFAANPLLLCRFSIKEIIYIFCHEIDHVLLNHPAEMVKSNPERDEETFRLFNLAADAAVNDRLNYEIKTQKRKFMSPPEGLITSDSLAKMFRIRNIVHMESYAYYFELIRNKQKDKPANGSPQNGQELIMQKQLAKDGADKDMTLSDHDWDVENDAENAASAVRELVNAAAGMMSEESRGLMPGRFTSQVELLNRPPVLSWQAILKKYIGTITASKRKTRLRLNRRQPERFDLSGSIDDKLLKIAVAIDTSGSVSDTMIAGIFSEIFAILAKRRYEITVIECDSEVQRVYKARTPADIQLKVAGRGGTSFTPVIEYVNNDRYFRDALLIYFTDGYGEYEIPRPKTYRNLWIVIGGADNLSVKEPYGAVLSL